MSSCRKKLLMTTVFFYVKIIDARDRIFFVR